MENSSENLLHGSIKVSLPPMMNSFYPRTDSDKNTIITIKNEGPGDLKYNIFDMGKEDRNREQTLYSGSTRDIPVADFGNGNTLKVETVHQPVTFTATNVKRPY